MDPKSNPAIWPRAGLEIRYNIWLGSIPETHYLEIHLMTMQETELEKWASLTQVRHKVHCQAQAQMRSHTQAHGASSVVGGSDKAPLRVSGTCLNRACPFFMLI